MHWGTFKQDNRITSAAGGDVGLARYHKGCYRNCQRSTHSILSSFQKFSTSRVQQINIWIKYVYSEARKLLILKSGKIWRCFGCWFEKKGGKCTYLRALILKRRSPGSPSMCGSPSATNGYSCPSLMPASISISNNFSSGTILQT